MVFIATIRYAARVVVSPRDDDLVEEFVTLSHRGFESHPLLLLYNRQQKADGVKQDWTNPPPAHPTGRLAWELRTPTLWHCECFLRTVPQACPMVLSKACRAVSAITGTQPRASGGKSPVSASGGSYASIHRN